MEDLSIRSLDATADFDIVLDLYRRAADYCLIESGLPPGPATVRDFLTDLPPGGDLARSKKLGVFLDGRCCGIADLAFDYPRPQDAYLGLLLLAPECRGQGLGPRIMTEIERLARARSAPRLYLAVLEHNSRAHRFWRSQGFCDDWTSPPVTMGNITQRRHRLVKPL